MMSLPGCPKWRNALEKIGFAVIIKEAPCEQFGASFSAINHTTKSLSL